MAYVFDQINGLLGDEKKDPNASTNIFAPEESQMGNQQAGGEQPAGGNQVKTSAEGEIGGNGSGGGGQTAETKPTAGPQVADSRLMRKNKVKEAPQFAKKAEGALGEAQTNLQNEANAYVDAARKKDYTVSTDNIEKAIGGDQDQQAGVQRLMGGTADKADYFAPKTNVNVADIEAMQSDGGLDSILRRESGPEYSAGEAAFDRSLLNRSADFNQLRSLLKTNQGNLQKQADEWSGAEGVKSKEAQGLYDKNFETAKTAATGYLGDQSTSLKKLQDDDAIKENAARKALREGKDPKFATDQEQNVIAKLIADYQGTDPAGVLKYIKAGLVDPKTYAKVAGDVTWDQGVDDKEATRFNSIMGLLGKTDAWQAGGGFGDRQSFDSKGLTSAIESAAKGKNLAADKGAQATIDRIKATLEKRKADEIAYRDQMKLTPNQLGATDAMAVEKIRQDLMKEYGNDPALKDIYNNWGSMVSTGDYVNYNPVNSDSLAWLDQGEADAMNSALAEIGGQYNKVGVGAGAGPRSAFDKEGYASALRQLILGRKAAGAVGNVSVNPNKYEVANRPINDFEKAKNAKVDVKDPTGRKIRV